jgi:hypothetical protein
MPVINMPEPMIAYGSASFTRRTSVVRSPYMEIVNNGKNFSRISSGMPDRILKALLKYRNIGQKR